MGKEMVELKDKTLLTLCEAAALTGIGIHKLRKMTEEEGCDFVLWNGTRRLLKRKKLLAYIDNVKVI